MKLLWKLNKIFEGDFVMRKYYIFLVVAILALVTIVVIGGCASADEQYSNTVKEEKDFLPIVGETGQGKVYQLNEFCFIYENSRSYAPSQPFCMTVINQ